MLFSSVFDVTRVGFNDLFWLLPGTSLILIASLLSLFRRYLRSSIPAIIAWAIATPVFVWVIVTGFIIISHKIALSDALKKGECDVTEGFVTDFEPMPYAGHRDEAFVVGGTRFHYSDYVITPGFRHSASHGGPLRAGEYVRIYHVGNDIARLEIARP